MERCKKYFMERNAKFLFERIHEFSESSATVELAATRLNCDPAHIAKSLSFLQKRPMSKAEAKAHQKKVSGTRKQSQSDTAGSASDSTNAPSTGSPTTTLDDGQVAVIVAAGDAKVSAKKYKEKFGCQPHMLKREMVEPYTGYPPGGVCPFGLQDNVKVYLDVSLKRFPFVYPAAGTSNSGIKITLDELEQYASNVIEWVDLCEGWWPPAEGDSATTMKSTTTTTSAVDSCDIASKKMEHEASKSVEAMV